MKYIYMVKMYRIYLKLREFKAWKVIYLCYVILYYFMEDMCMRLFKA